MSEEAFEGDLNRKLEKDHVDHLYSEIEKLEKKNEELKEEIEEIKKAQQLNNYQSAIDGMIKGGLL